VYGPAFSSTVYTVCQYRTSRYTTIMTTRHLSNCYALFAPLTSTRPNCPVSLRRRQRCKIKHQRHLNQICYIDVGRHSTPYLKCITTCSEIQHGGGLHLEFSLKSQRCKMSSRLIRRVNYLIVTDGLRTTRAKRVIAKLTSGQRNFTTGRIDGSMVFARLR